MKKNQAVELPEIPDHFAIDENDEFENTQLQNNSHPLLSRLICFLILGFSLLITSFSLYFHSKLPHDLHHVHGVFNRILDSYDISPIVDVKIIATESDCPSGYKLEKIGTFTELSQPAFGESYSKMDLLVWKDKKFCVRRFKDQQVGSLVNCNKEGWKLCRPTLCAGPNELCPITNFNSSDERKENFAENFFEERYVKRELESQTFLDIIFSYHDYPCLASGFFSRRETESSSNNGIWGCGEFGIDDMVVKMDFGSEADLYQSNKVPGLSQKTLKSVNNTVIFLVARKSLVKDTGNCLEKRAIVAGIFDSVTIMYYWKRLIIVILLIIQAIWIFSTGFVMRVAQVVQGLIPAIKRTSGGLVGLLVFGVAELILLSYMLYFGWVDETNINDVTFDQLKSCLRGAQTKLIINKMSEVNEVTVLMHYIFLINTGLILVRNIVVCILLLYKKQLSYQKL